MCMMCLCMGLCLYKRVKIVCVMLHTVAGSPRSGRLGRRAAPHPPWLLFCFSRHLVRPGFRTLLYRCDNDPNLVVSFHEFPRSPLVSTGVREHLWRSPLQGGQPGSLYGGVVPVSLRHHVRRHWPRHVHCLPGAVPDTVLRQSGGQKGPWRDDERNVRGFQERGSSLGILCDVVWFLSKVGGDDNRGNNSRLVRSFIEKSKGGQ